MTAALAALRAVPELAGCSTRDLRSLLPYFDEVGFSPGDLVAVEGAPCTEFAVVVDGLLEAGSTAVGRRVLSSGDGIGWEAMWDRGHNGQTVRAATAATVLVMSHAQFRAAKAVAEPPTSARSGSAGTTAAACPGDVRGRPASSRRSA